MKKVPIAIAAFSAVVLSSCAMDFPQTRAEFTDHPKVHKQTYTVPRKLDAVVASLDKQANRCVNGETIQHRMAGSMVSGSRDAYLMTVEKTSPSRAELTYRQASSNMAFQPKGGFFMLAANLEAQGAKSTKVTLYHGPLQKTLINAVTEWSKGNDQACHGYGGK
jgi:hypothetical protein